MNELTAAHMAGEQRLRELAVTGVGSAWERLAGYDREDIPAFVAAAVPVVLAAQRQSAALTNAYLARVLRARPVALDYSRVTGAAVRAGAEPADVYARPFVTAWTALKAGRPYEDAVNTGLARAKGMAAMDVQLSARATMGQVQDATPAIRGYRRRANPGACAFCQLVDGAFVQRADAAALHNWCGCGLEPVFFDQPVPALPEGVAVSQHGELGATLHDPAHDFALL